MNADSVVDWWLGPARQDLAKLGERMPYWFGASEEMDAQISEQFGEAIVQASLGDLDDWAEEPVGRLALVLLMDQFRRNVYRGTADAFACDDLALDLCLGGIEAGMDRQLGLVERIFFFMPLQHAESEPVQHKAVETYDALASEAPDEVKEIFEGCANYARLHRDIVLEFGRFPHRNTILGRDSTEEELAFLMSGPSFGQG
ncbi:MAG: DUF924 family protein [Pseudomonadota bacterium]